MFPFEDEDPRAWSEYGAVLKPDEFRKKTSMSPFACSSLSQLLSCVKDWCHHDSPEYVFRFSARFAASGKDVAYGLS